VLVSRYVTDKEKNKNETLLEQIISGEYQREEIEEEDGGTARGSVN
jgi:hypothetical protein